jgi:predicted lipoprotein with Yx(FWY)xxD motif
MTPRKSLATLASAAVIALVVAGCGSSGGSSSSSSAKPASSTGSSVMAASTPLGKIITDSQGRTLYRFGADTGMQSNCTGACSSNWPPFTATSKPALGSGLSAGAITLVKRSDGAKQVTLDGHPLYYFSGDQSAGQTNGQGVDEFGGKWFTVGPSGSQVTTAPKASGNSSTSGGGYGY